MFELFWTFFKIGLFTFGGGYSMIPLLSEELTRFNIDMYEFTDYIAISEATPGPFAVNIATFIGFKMYGLFGAIFTTLAVCLPSFIIITLLAIFINKVKDSSIFKSFIKIATPITLGLILSSILKIANQNLFNISNIYKFKEQFSISVICLYNLLILLIFYLINLLIKKKKLSPFFLIILSLYTSLFTCLFVNA